MYLHYLFKKQNLRQLKTNKVSLKVFCEDLRTQIKLKVTIKVLFINIEQIASL